MAEGKLIDAEALVVALNLDRFPNLLRTYEYDTKRTIQAQPDASEPLRKRVAELEAEKSTLVRSLGEVVLSPSYGSGQFVEHGVIWNQVAIEGNVYVRLRDLWIDLKGAQDA